jgi:hypothetical protein
VFFGAVVFACQAQQFEQENAPPDVGRVVPEFDAQRLDGLVELARLEKRLCFQGVLRLA